MDQPVHKFNQGVALYLALVIGQLGQLAHNDHDGGASDEADARNMVAGERPDTLGLYLLESFDKPVSERTERTIRETQDVRECHNVTGTYEYLLRVEVADIVAYKTFHSKVLGGLPQVDTITTFVVIDSPKDERA